MNSDGRTALPRRVRIREVGPRDGFQNEARFIETDDKVALIDRLSACGFAKIEVTSFTSPRAIPALRDAEAVMHRIERRPGVIYTVLVIITAIIGGVIALVSSKTSIDVHSLGSAPQTGQAAPRYWAGEF